MPLDPNPADSLGAVTGCVMGIAGKFGRGNVCAMPTAGVVGGFQSGAVNVGGSHGCVVTVSGGCCNVSVCSVAVTVAVVACEETSTHESGAVQP